MQMLQCPGSIVVPDRDAVFFAKNHLQEVQEYIDNFDGPRNLHTLDFFCGEANFYKRSCHRNLASERFDWLLDPIKQNIIHRSGFFNGLHMVLSVTQFPLR